MAGIMPQLGMRPQIILLRDGTDTSQGIGQLVSNINACQAVVETIRTTLGPRGMDKLIHTDRNVTISNDGATIMKLLDIVHPAAKILVDIAKSQDAEIGDGTTSVVLTAGALLTAAKSFVQENVHPQVIVRGFRRALKVAVDKLRELGVGFELGGTEESRRARLIKCAKTSMNSKLIARYKDFFAPMVVDCIECLDKDMDLKQVGVKKVPGGSVTESFLVQGVAFKRTFSYAGFEQQPKKFADPKILLLNLELELQAEASNAEIRLTKPGQYQSIVDAEWDIIYDKLAKCVASGAQIILSKKPIGDLATQYFADRDLFCAGRVSAGDLERVARATRGKIQTTVHGLTADVLGTCAKFEEVQVGAERYNVFKGCPEAKTATLVLRGGAEQFIDETARSLHDSLMIVKNCVKSSTIVAGGGATELEISRTLKEFSRTLMGKEQLVVAAYAKALEMIPRQLADNAGFDSTDVLNRLRQKHATAGAGKWFGVDIEKEGICDTIELGVWEPVNSKINSLSAATDAACLVLSIDETVRNPKSQEAPGAGGRGSGRGMGGRGMPMSAAMGGGGMRGMARGMMGRGRGVRAYRGKGGK